MVTLNFRPVMGIFEVDVTNIDKNKRESLFHDVVSKQGPSDGTVVVTFSNQTQFDDNEQIDTVISQMSEVGDILLVRYILSHIIHISI